MNKLQKPLLINAIFSSISGILMIFFNGWLANIFEIQNVTVFKIIGFLLLFFAITIIYETFKQRPLAILWIIIQDFIWVIASLFLIIINPFEISKSGNTLITIIAFVVFFMGTNQSKALAQVDTTENKKMKHFRFERIIKADKKSVWNVISDVANYDKVAPNIDAVKIIEGQGLGMVRSCSHGNDNWTENCTLWQEEKTYSFVVNTNDANYPYPFKFLKGTWQVEEINANETKIVMLFDFEYKRKFQNWLLHPLLRGKFTNTAEKLLDNWQKLL